MKENVARSKLINHIFILFVCLYHRIMALQEVDFKWGFDLWNNKHAVFPGQQFENLKSRGKFIGKFSPLSVLCLRLKMGNMKSNLLSTHLLFRWMQTANAIHATMSVTFWIFLTDDCCKIFLKNCKEALISFPICQLQKWNSRLRPVCSVSDASLIYVLCSLKWELSWNIF